MILSLPWTIIFGIGSILMGAVTIWMAVLDVRDARNQQGKFSKRHQAAFGRWKITRTLVRINSWTNLLALIGGGPLLIGVGLWLMLQ